MEKYSVGKTYPDFMKFDSLLEWKTKPYFMHREEQRCMLIFFWRSVWKDFLYLVVCICMCYIYIYTYLALVKYPLYTLHLNHTDSHSPSNKHSTCLYKLSGQTRTNSLIEYRITIFAWLSKRPFLCPTCWAFYCPRIKADTYQARDNRQSTLLTQFIRPGSQKGLSNKGFCRQTHTHTLQFRMTAGKRWRTSRENKNWRTKTVLHLKQDDHAFLARSASN